MDCSAILWQTRSAGQLVATAIAPDHVGGHVSLVAERSVAAGLGVGASPAAAPPAAVNIVGARAGAWIAGAGFGDQALRDSRG